MANRTYITDFLGIEVKEQNPKINSRTKGMTNERDCAKVLEKWAGVPFARVPSSGGLRWKDTVNACGDLICQDQNFDFPFSVETKHLKNLNVTAILRENSFIFTIYQQALRDSQRAEKCPMLILRKNGMKKGEYVVYFPFDIYNLFTKSKGKDPISEHTLYGYLSKELFTKMGYEEIKNKAKEWIKNN